MRVAAVLQRCCRLHFNAAMPSADKCMMLTLRSKETFDQLMTANTALCRHELPGRAGELLQAPAASEARVPSQLL